MTNVSLAEVVTLYDTNCRDIPEMMRGSADMIELEAEQGIQTEAMLGIRLTDSGGVEIYGWGDCDNLKAIALLQLAMMSITSSTLGYD